jgi:hypothetical protein
VTSSVPYVSDDRRRISKRGNDSQHRYLQELIKRWADANNVLATIEKPILDGMGRVDVALERESVAFACEVSVTNAVAYELDNCLKCLTAGFQQVALVVIDARKAMTCRKAIDKLLPADQQPRVQVLGVEELFGVLELFFAAPTQATNVRGYRVRTTFSSASSDSRRAVAETVLKAVRRMSRKG